MKVFFIISMVLILFSCSNRHTLNTKNHKFNKGPNKIIWIQVDGLTNEHMGFLKYGLKKINEDSVLDNFSCTGNSWDYNVSKLRPAGDKVFLSQLYGKISIDNSCMQDAIWDRLTKFGYVTPIIEKTFNKTQSIENKYFCKKDNTDERIKKIFEQKFYWKMGHLSKNSKKINFNSKNIFVSGNFVDSQCVSKNCNSSLFQNSKKIFKELTNGTWPYFYLIRDFSFKYHLIKGDSKRALSMLTEIKNMLDYYTRYVKRHNNVLLIVSTAAGVPVIKTIKSEGKISFDKNTILKKYQNYNSPFWVMGASAENFCGQIDSHQFLNRLFWRRTEKSFFSF